MTRIPLARRCACCAAIWLMPLALLADAPPASAPLSAEALLRQAVASDTAGCDAQRDALLHAALLGDPDCSLARWQSGALCWNGRWIDADEAVDRADANGALAEYRRRRNAALQTLDEQRALARWCHQHELTEEARVHWMNVLELAPNDRGAVRALDLHWYRNRIRTSAEIAQEKEDAAAHSRAVRFWRPTITTWRNAIARGSTRQRLNALLQLRALVDPAAIPTLESVFATRGVRDASVRLNLLLVETAARLPGRAATAVLVRRAVLAEPAQVRRAAIHALKESPLYTFVPTLIAAAPGAVMTRYQQLVSDVGGVTVSYRLLQQGNGAPDTVVFDVDLRGTVPIFIGPAVVLSNASRAVNVRGGTLKDRIQTVLEETLDIDDLDDPDQWERTWYAYNGWDAPKYRVRTWNNYSSCFPAGTGVPTLAGPMPIERIRAGDRVLAVDPQSGELAYKAVQRTTRRGMTPIVKINCADHSVRATPGHPFWIVGSGWQVAKHVEPGDRLFTVGGSAQVESIEQEPATPVFNLVVNDFHTFAVGELQVLVHDNSPLRTGAALVPGLLAEAKPATR